MTYEDMVDRIYTQIIDEATSGILFGVPVDVNNMKVLVVASYFIGKKSSEPKQTAIIEGTFNE